MSKHRHATRLPMVRVVLVVIPLLGAARFATTALWSTPAGVGVLGEPALFDSIYWSAAAASIGLAVVNRTRLHLSLYTGIALTLLCTYRAVTVFPMRSTFGPVAYSAVVNWVTFAVITLAGVMLSVQYILVVEEIKRVQAGESSALGERVLREIQEAEGA